MTSEMFVRAHLTSANVHTGGHGSCPNASCDFSSFETFLPPLIGTDLILWPQILVWQRIGSPLHSPAALRTVDISASPDEPRRSAGSWLSRAWGPRAL
ncbi:MAG: hypothetical protein JWO71_4079 [Candidatus Acidoferrum typicum]|nr:hypothetical protein [Candidatus Acidoferrum typicum]